jgi:hypothetical protein
VGSATLSVGWHPETIRLNEIARGRFFRDRSVAADGGRGINDVCVVLLGEVAGHRILLTGDVEDDVDPLLLARLIGGLVSGGYLV